MKIPIRVKLFCNPILSALEDDINEFTNETIVEFNVVDIKLVVEPGGEFSPTAYTAMVLYR